jgi:hypothetical protein
VPSTPDFTKAQVLVIVTVIASLLKLFSIDIDADTQAEIAGGIVGLWLVFHLVSDAVIRHGRAGAFAAVTNHNATLATLHADESPEHDPAAVDAIAAELAAADAKPGG